MDGTSSLATITQVLSGTPGIVERACGHQYRDGPFDFRASLNVYICILKNDACILFIYYFF